MRKLWLILIPVCLAQVPTGPKLVPIQEIESTCERCDCVVEKAGELVCYCGAEWRNE